MSAFSTADAPSRGRMPRAHHPLTQLACADATQITTIVDADPLGSEVLAHLDAQIASVQRLLEIVLEQGAAIRARDVHTVVRFAGLLHGELARRGVIEDTRSELLQRAGALLGIPAQTVTLTRLAGLMDPAHAALAAERSARLRGLVEELRREHACNRALMQIELSFLDHLMRSLSLDAGVDSYDPRGSTAGRASLGGASAGGRAPVHALRVLDLRA
jgi:hypothetical protein